MKKKNISMYLASVISIGIIAKMISIVSRMILTRYLGQEAIGLYSLVNPILVLIITLSSFSLPTAVATLIAKNEGKERTILFSSLSLVCLISLGLIFILLLFIDQIAITLLFNKDTIYSLYATLLVIPLTSISAIIKGYFLGSGEVSLTSYSQVFEESGRLLFILLCSYFLLNTTNPQKASIAIYSLASGEIFQISCMLIFSKPKYRKKLFEYSKCKDCTKEVKSLLNISLPLTGSRLIGSLTYCLEPIIFTHLMAKAGFSNSYIAVEYGILNSYVLPLLMMPSFISLSLSNYLLPNLGSLVKKQNYLGAKKLLKRIIFFSLLIGIGISFVFIFAGEYLLKILYGDVIGLNYLKGMCFFFVIYYVEAPIVTALSIFSLSKNSFLSTIISSSIRIILLLILIPKFHVLGIAIATLSSVFIDVLINILFIRRFFKRNNIEFIF